VHEICFAMLDTRHRTIALYELLWGIYGYTQVIGAVVVGIAVDPLDSACRPFTMMPAPDHIQDRIALPVNADCLTAIVCVPSAPIQPHHIREGMMPLPNVKSTFRFEVG
jgi:hypothetical protein